VKKLIVLTVVVFSVLGLYAEKPRLAVMEFEDRSETLDETMLSNAAEYLRSEFVSSGTFIVIAKERQSRVMIKEMRKESYEMCRDKDCQIPLGQALSADTILRTSINYFGGVYTITSELIDLAKEATVRGSRFQFDGSEMGLMQAMDRIAVQLAGATPSFKPDVLKDEKLAAGVELGGVELSALPAVEVSVGEFDDVSRLGTIQKLESVTLTETDAGIDALEAYDKAVTADENGDANPQLAALRWKELYEIKDSNPFRERAKKRYDEWGRHIQMKELGGHFERAKQIDVYGKLFPELAIEAWEILTKKTHGNPYYETATRRSRNWKEFSTQIAHYKEQQQAFGKQRHQDEDKLVRALPLRVLNDSQKRAMMVKYLELYGPFYGVDDIERIFSAIGREKSRPLVELLYNDYLYQEMKEKCDKGQASGCYIYASLTEVEQPEQSLQYFERACSQGVVDGCIKAGRNHYDKGNFEQAFTHFSDACGWESPEGCHITAFMIETGMGTERDQNIATMLYKKACDSRYEISCRMHKNIRQYGYSSDQVKNLVEKGKFDKKISDAVGSEGEDLAREVRPRAKFDDATMTVKVKDKYYPYWKGGVTMIVIGAGLILGGVTGFELAANSQYDEYKIRTTDAKIIEAIKLGKSQDDYLKSVNKYKDKEELYHKLAIVSGVTGGALIISGIITAAVTKEREVLKKVSFSTDGKGFYAGLGFEF
jgi:TPR repeat protein